MESNSKLNTIIAVIFLIVLNIALALLFHSAEHGFRWYLSFLALSIGVLLLFALLLNLAAKRALESKQKSVAEEQSQESEK